MAIDMRHPTSWENSLFKDQQRNPTNFGYSAKKLTAARFYQLLDDADWHARNEGYMTILNTHQRCQKYNEWQSFEYGYNRVRAAKDKEDSTTLALLYAATKTYTPMRRARDGHHPVSYVPHSCRMWREILNYSPGQSLKKPILVTSVRMPDGSRAMMKLRILANGWSHRFVNYDTHVARPRRRDRDRFVAVPPRTGPEPQEEPSPTLAANTGGSDTLRRRSRPRTEEPRQSVSVSTSTQTASTVKSLAQWVFYILVVFLAGFGARILYVISTDGVAPRLLS